MAIIQCEEQQQNPERKTCSFCGQKLTFPYIEWHSAMNVAICRCIVREARGLLTDIVTMQAIAEVQRVNLDYTLKLTTVSAMKHDLIAQARREKESDR